MKKRAQELEEEGRRAGSVDSEESPAPPKGAHGREPAVLAYLGIQRKDSTDSNKDSEQSSIADSADSVPSIVKRSQGPKAKKSFRPREENETQNK